MLGFIMPLVARRRWAVLVRRRCSYAARDLSVFRRTGRAPLHAPHAGSQVSLGARRRPDTVCKSVSAQEIVVRISARGSARTRRRRERSHPLSPTAGIDPYHRFRGGLEQRASERGDRAEGTECAVRIPEEDADFGGLAQGAGHELSIAAGAAVDSARQPTRPASAAAFAIHAFRFCMTSPLCPLHGLSMCVHEGNVPSGRTMFEGRTLSLRVVLLLSRLVTEGRRAGRRVGQIAGRCEGRVPPSCAGGGGCAWVVCF